MSADEYWNASPNMVIAYRKAFEYRTRELREQLWVQGLYIYKAVNAVVANAFCKGHEKYPEKPFGVETEKPDSDLNETDIEKQREALAQRLEDFRNSFNSKKREGEKSHDDRKS